MRERRCRGAAAQTEATAGHRVVDTRRRLRSILERAAELGGTAVAGPAGEGWEVSARLPLDGLAASDRD
jgi:hypothetical protein